MGRNECNKCTIADELMRTLLTIHPPCLACILRTINGFTVAALSVVCCSRSQCVRAQRTSDRMSARTNCIHRVLVAPPPPPPLSSPSNEKKIEKWMQSKQNCKWCDVIFFFHSFSCDTLLSHSADYNNYFVSFHLFHYCCPSVVELVHMHLSHFPHTVSVCLCCWRCDRCQRN